MKPLPTSLVHYRVFVCAVPIRPAWLGRPAGRVRPGRASAAPNPRPSLAIRTHTDKFNRNYSFQGLKRDSIDSIQKRCDRKTEMSLLSYTINQVNDQSCNSEHINERRISVQ